MNRCTRKVQGKTGVEVCKPDYDLRGVCELWKRTKESS